MGVRAVFFLGVSRAFLGRFSVFLSIVSAIHYDCSLMSRHDVAEFSVDGL
jgi:hypothetical protein